MPLSKKRTYQRHSEPKVFQCTGFGDCHMVFSRSEHLARHARKHTGEKPFKCVVPGCERAFSRFDNMIQHTSTHNKKSNGNKKNTQNKKINTSNENMEDMNSNKNVSKQHLVPLIAIPVNMDYSSLSPPPDSRLSLPASPVSDTDSPFNQRLPSISNSYLQHSPTTTSTSMDYFSHINKTPNAISPVHPTFLPSPKELLLHQMPSYPLKSSSDYDHQSSVDCSDTWSSISSLSPSSTASISSSPVSPPSPTLPTLPPFPYISSGGDLSRRLSYAELALPIQDLSSYHGAGTNGVVNITCDEFAALQAFSHLSSPLCTRGFPFVTKKSRPSSLSLNIGATQVNSLRQNLALAHESSSRLSPRSSI